MKALTIKDLAVTAELDSKAMAGVRGGSGWKMPSFGLPKYEYAPQFSYTEEHVKQVNTQFQSNATGNGSAVFGHGGIFANNVQTASNVNL